jgi:two-component system, NtrC family, response regulator AtoC
MNKQKRILAVDDEPSMRRLLEISLRQAGYEPISAGDGREALQIIKSQQVDLVVSDLHMPGMNGLDLLKTIRADNEALPFIMVTAQGEIKTAVEAMKLGAADYILRPFDLETLEVAIAKALSIQRLQLENTYFKSEISDNLIGQSESMLALKKLISQVAPENATVLITGETGTGKELIAKAIHEASTRKNALFVAVNCAAIPGEMLESELFGHEKGAFTGAVKERIGKFELADGGTLFLDEITEMPIHLQAKLLRALQEGTIEKLGSNKQVNLDIRVIAATNIDPLQAVKSGKMREDLYYRLNVFQLLAPRLRQRGSDIVLLAQHFAAKKRCALNDEAKQTLLNYAWPGNVRELENVLERASILASDGTITPQHLPHDMTGVVEPTGHETFQQSGFSIPKATEQIERKLIAEAITHCQGNKAKAAKLLEISERSLWYKLEQFHLK